MKIKDLLSENQNENSDAELFFDEYDHRQIIAFIKNRWERRVDLSGTLDDAIHKLEFSGKSIEDVIQDWKEVESYGDIDQYVRNAMPDGGDDVGDAWVYGDAVVSSDAPVSGDAVVSDKLELFR